METKIDVEGMRKRAAEGAALAGKAAEGPWVKWMSEPSVFCRATGEHTRSSIQGVQVAGCDYDDLSDLPEFADEDDFNIDDVVAEKQDHNAAFIADARTRVPDLAADVLALCAEVERLRAEIQADVDAGIEANEAQEMADAAHEEEFKKLRDERDAARKALDEANAQIERWRSVVAAAKQWWATLGRSDMSPHAARESLARAVIDLGDP